MSNTHEPHIVPDGASELANKSYDAFHTVREGDGGGPGGLGGGAGAGLGAGGAGGVGGGGGPITVATPYAGTAMRRSPVVDTLVEPACHSAATPETRVRKLAMPRLRGTDIDTVFADGPALTSTMASVPCSACA